MQQSNVSGVRPRRKQGRRAAAGLAAALLVLAACSDSDDPEDSGGDSSELTGDPVRIGFIGDGQSAAADNEIEVQVAEAAVKWINAERDGIGGRPVELVVCRTENDPAKAADCGNQMVEEGVPLVAVGSTGVYQNLWEPLHAAGIPTFFYAPSGEQILGDTKSTFGLATPSVNNVAYPIGIAEKEDLDKVTVVAIDVPAAYAGFQGALGDLYEAAGVELELVRVPIGTADMTPQLQSVLRGDPGVVHVIGNDTFCIAALQAMEALSFDGPISFISQCLSDATREAFPDGALEGVHLSLPSPLGASEASKLYRSAMKAHGPSDLDVTRSGGVNSFVLFAAIDVALDDLDGELTPASAIATIRAMEESELPNGGGVTFRCDGKQVPIEPAACTNQVLYTVLDAQGQPTETFSTASD